MLNSCYVNVTWIEKSISLFTYTQHRLSLESIIAMGRWCCRSEDGDRFEWTRII
jgi:hypothetical protein